MLYAFASLKCSKNARNSLVHGRYRLLLLDDTYKRFGESTQKRIKYEIRVVD